MVGGGRERGHHNKVKCLRPSLNDNFSLITWPILGSVKMFILSLYFEGNKYLRKGDEYLGKLDSVIFIALMDARRFHSHHQTPTISSPIRLVDPPPQHCNLNVNPIK